MIGISKEDISVLRELGEKYMSYAALPVQQEKRSMWVAHNGLRSPRPLVLIDQMPWNELDVDGSLVCRVEEPYFRGVKWELRRTIYKWEHLSVDMVLDPYISIPSF